MLTTDELERALVEALPDDARLANAIDALVGRLLSGVSGYSERSTDGFLLEYCHREPRRAQASGVAVMLNAGSEPVRVSLTLNESGDKLAFARVHFGDSTRTIGYQSREHRKRRDAILIRPMTDHSWRCSFYRDHLGWHSTPGAFDSPGAAVIEFGQWRYRHDRNATDAAYADADAGGVAICTCTPCRNFEMARGRVFPRSFLDLLRTLGIDPTKDGEVYHMGRSAPGLHFYGGWYHFVGVLDSHGDFPEVTLDADFSCSLQPASSPHLSTLDNLPLVQVEFRADRVPWVLDQQEPE